MRRLFFGNGGIAFLTGNALALAVKLLHQQQDGGLMRERDMPVGQTGIVVVQLQIADAAMVLQTHGLPH